MKYGIITDIHNNVIPLRAVLKRLNQMNCSRIICCGDNVDEVIHQINMINYPESDIIKKYFYGL